MGPVAQRALRLELAFSLLDLDPWAEVACKGLLRNSPWLNQGLAHCAGASLLLTFRPLPQ